jgi:anti-sigma factor RsiW
MRTDMNCADVRSLLEEYFEGLVVDRRADAIAKHLATCPGCAFELHQIERVAGALAVVPQAEPAEDLLRTISARIAALPAPRQGRVAVGWRWVGVMAAVVLAFLTVVSYLLPVLISESAASGIAVIGPVREASVMVHEWFAAAPDLLFALWLALGKVWQWFALAARAAAPTLGMYLIAEIGILWAIVFVVQTRSGQTPARQALVI